MRTFVLWAPAFVNLHVGLPKITVDERTTLLRIAASVNWAPGDLDKIALCISPPDNPARGRREMQNWAPAFLSYFTQTEWDEMQDTASTTVHQNIVFQRLICLGARCLGETTLKGVTSLLIYLQMRCRKDRAMVLPGESKKYFLESVKKAFKKRVRDLRHPIAYVLEIPTEAGVLQQEQPALFNSAFPGDALPAPCPVSIVDVADLDNSYGCRGASRVASSAVVAYVTPGSSGASESAMERMFNSMCALQQQNLAILAPSASAQPPRALARLADMSSPASSVPDSPMSPPPLDDARGLAPPQALEGSIAAPLVMLKLAQPALEVTSLYALDVPTAAATATLEGEVGTASSDQRQELPQAVAPQSSMSCHASAVPAGPDAAPAVGLAALETSGPAHLADAARGGADLACKGGPATPPSTPPRRPPMQAVALPLDQPLTASGMLEQYLVMEKGRRGKAAIADAAAAVAAAEPAAVAAAEPAFAAAGASGANAAATADGPPAAPAVVEVPDAAVGQTAAAPAVAASPAAAVAAPPAAPVKVKRQYTKRVAAAPTADGPPAARAEIASPAPPMKKARSSYNFKPTISHEKSRRQFLVRSGELKLKSVAFMYKEDCAAAKAEEDARGLLSTWHGLWGARELFVE